MVKKIVFPGNFDSLDKVCRYVEQVAREAGFDEVALYAIETAVDEAFSNIIDHAYGGENKGEVECNCQVKDEALVIKLHDHGKAFNPDSIPDPDLISDLDKRRERGLGLYFMRKLMDEVSFEFSGKNGNTLTLVKRKEKKG